MLWDVALRNLWQRRLRSFLTVLSVAVVVQLYMLISGGMATFDQDLQRQASAFTGKTYVQQSLKKEGEPEPFPSLGSSIPVQVASEILALDNHDQSISSALLFVRLAKPPMPNAPPGVMAVGIEPGHETAYLGNFEIEFGQATLTDAHSVILGRAAARHYGYADEQAVGETITIMNQPFTVVGVLESAPWLFDGTVLMPLATAQDVFARPETVSAVVLAGDNIESTVRARFPRLQVLGQDGVADNARQSLSTAKLFMNIINSTVVAVMVVVIAIVMIMAVIEQRREIGTLRAIGARRRAIWSLVVSGSLSLCFFGALVALPLWAIVHKLILPHVSASIAIMVSADMALSSWRGTLGLVLVAGVVASLWPAWQAIRVDPLEALRYD
jgi:putative ABC transport system permease protein